MANEWIPTATHMEQLHLSNGIYWNKKNHFLVRLTKYTEWVPTWELSRQVCCYPTPQVGRGSVTPSHQAIDIGCKKERKKAYTIVGFMKKQWFPNVHTLRGYTSGCNSQTRT